MRLRPCRTRSWTCHLDRRYAGGGLASVLGDTVLDLPLSIAPSALIAVIAGALGFGRLALLGLVSLIAVYASGARSKRALAVLAFLTRRPPSP
jgi:hypothetical protein